MVRPRCPRATRAPPRVLRYRFSWEARSSANCEVDIRADAGQGQWRAVFGDLGSADLGSKPKGVLWRRHPQLPLIAAADMLRTDAGAPGPSRTRSLIPEAIADVEFVGPVTGGLPSVAGSAAGRFGWEWPDIRADHPFWGKASVSLVSPTTPGMEFRPENPQTPLGDQMVSLRYDLPILDELFAGVKPPKPARTQQEDETAADPGRPITALTPDRLAEDVWVDRGVSLSLTRTQSARATAWTGEEAAASELYNLAAPYRTRASVKFRVTWDEAGIAQPVSSYPLGAFAIDWQNGDAVEIFAGDRALAGVAAVEVNDAGGIDTVGPTFFRIDDNLLRRDPAISQPADNVVPVIGFATGLYSRGGQRRYDTRGLGLEDRLTDAASSFGDKIKVRKAGRLTSTRRASDHPVTEAEFSLATLAEPIETDDGALFWFRDLPMTQAAGGLRFDGRRNPIESSLGPNMRAFDRSFVGEAVFEWRLAPASADKYELPFGPLAFRPLRLLMVDTNGSVTVLGSVGLRRGDPDQSVFADDKPYHSGNLVAVTYTLSDVGGELRLVRQSAARQRLSTPVSQAADLSDLAEDNAEISLNMLCDLAPLGSTGEPATRQRVTLLFEMTGHVTAPLGNASIRTTLIGSKDVQLSGGTVDLSQSGKMVITFGDGAEPQGLGTSDGVYVTRAVLTVTEGDEVANLTVQAAANVRTHNHDNAPSLIKLSNDLKMQWLGITMAAPVEGAAEKARAIVDHTRGTVGLWFAARDDGAISLPDDTTPIRGLEVTNPSLWLHASLVLAPAEETPNDALAAWTVTDLQFGARMRGESLGGELRLRCSASKTGKETLETQLLIDQVPEDWSPSGVHWPVDALEIDPAAVVGGKRAARTVGTSEPWSHELRPVLNAHELPIEALASTQNDPAVHLAAPVRLLVRVDHRFRRGQDVRSWTTLDHVTLIDAQKIQALASELFAFDSPQERSYAFAPRYRADSYRDYEDEDRREENRRRILNAGIVRPMLAASGFVDERLIRALLAPGLTAADGLIGFGGSPLVFTEDQSQAVVFSAPWVIQYGADSVDALPAPLRALQSFRDGAAWEVAFADGDPLIVDARGLAGEQINGTSGREDRIHAALNGLARVETAGGWSDYELVEQGYFEPADLTENPGTNTDPGPLALREWPLFLRALIGLKEVLASEAVSLANHMTSLHRLREESGQPQRVASVTFNGTPPTDRKGDIPAGDFFKDAVSLRLRAVSVDGTSAQAPILDRSLISGGELAAIGRTRLREQAEALVTTPVAITAIGLDEDEFPVSALTVVPRDRPGQVRRSAAPAAGRARDNLSLPRLWLASEQRGGCNRRRADRRRRPACGLRPIGSGRSLRQFWLAGNGVEHRRQRSFSRDIRARDFPKAGGYGPPWPIRFEPNVWPARARLGPGIAQGASAWRGCAQAGDGQDRTGRFRTERGGAASRADPDLSRAETGHRRDRGRYHLGRFCDRQSRSKPARVRSARNGSPGDLQTLRTPRAPALPRDQDIGLRRRTFVSLADMDEATGSFDHFLLSDTVATVFRSPQTNGAALRDHRFLIELPKPELGAAFRNKPELLLDVTLAAGEAMDEAAFLSALHLAGLLSRPNGGAANQATLQAGLEIGQLRLAFATMTWRMYLETPTLPRVKITPAA